MGGACSMNWKGMKYVENFSWKGTS